MNVTVCVGVSQSLAGGWLAALALGVCGMIIGERNRQYSSVTEQQQQRQQPVQCVRWSRDVLSWSWYIILLLPFVLLRLWLEIGGYLEVIYIYIIYYRLEVQCVLVFVISAVVRFIPDME